MSGSITTKIFQQYLKQLNYILGFGRIVTQSINNNLNVTIEVLSSCHVHVDFVETINMLIFVFIWGLLNLFGKTPSISFSSCPGRMWNTKSVGSGGI